MYNLNYALFIVFKLYIYVYVCLYFIATMLTTKNSLTQNDENLAAK